MYWLKRLLGIGVVLLLATAVVWTFAARQREATAVAANPAAPPSAAPTLPLAAYPALPSIAPAPTRALPAYPIATPTSPIPVVTPPTAAPTLTVGPPIPLPTINTPIASTASTIRYATVDRRSDQERPRYAYFHLPLGADNRAVGPAAAVALPATLSFSPYEIWPSPKGDYVVLMEPAEAGGVPHVVSRATGSVNSGLWGYGSGNFYGWHPDGRRFLFWSEGKGLWLIDAATLQRLTLAEPRASVQGAAISPDGQTVAYIADNLPATLNAIWLVSSSKGDAQPLLDAGGVAYMYLHAWAPDSRRLLFAGSCAPLLPKAQRETGGGGTPSPVPGPWCVVDVKTREAKPLAIPYAGFEPRWSPDGRFVAATGRASGEALCRVPKGEQMSEACVFQGRSIYVADVLTGQVQELTPGIAPVWSPDGSQLAFLSHRSGASEVWTIQMATRQVQQMTSHGQSTDPYTLAWLEEGQK